MARSRILHGFPGQRMVVLPREEVRRAGGHALLAPLQATDAGYFPRAAKHHVERKDGVQEAILILCLEGNGWVRFGAGKRLPVGPSEAVLIAPGAAHAYGADERSPWTIQWVHFIGTEVHEWWKWHGLPEAGGILRLRAGLAGELDLGRIHELLAFGGRRRVAAAAALRLALANLEAASVAESGESARRAVERVELWMREHTANRVSLSQLAKRAGLSVSHFGAVFRERFGHPPVDHFLRLRIGRACGLLEATDWPVKRIAEALGMQDPLYFSRRFRAVTGMAPRAFRAARRGVPFIPAGTPLASADNRPA